MDAEDYDELAGFYEISLRNQGFSTATVRSYMTGIRMYRDWCAAQGQEPSLSLRSAEAFTVSLLDAGRSKGTAGLRQLAVRLFSAWLAAQHPPEIVDELAGLKPPKLDSRVVDHLSDEQLLALLATCSDRRKLNDLRDNAIIRFMVSTTARADEVASMKTWDVQITAGSAVIIRGKGGKGRRVGFGPRTAEAVGRYSRARRRHALAAGPDLWLAEFGRVLTYQALYKSLVRRAEVAGVGKFHPHMLRHTAAIRWLRAGGSVTGLMAQGGWASVSMVQRYIQTASEELAIAESHRLDGGL
jgi:integrase/recombinase XerD